MATCIRGTLRLAPATRSRNPSQSAYPDRLHGGPGGPPGGPRPEAYPSGGMAGPLASLMRQVGLDHQDARAGPLDHRQPGLGARHLLELLADEPLEEVHRDVVLL